MSPCSPPNRNTSASDTPVRFPPSSALVVGNEGAGLPAEFLARCEGVVTVPQFGPVAA